MNHAPQPPSLDIYLPVVNIGETEAGALFDALRDTLPPKVANKTIRGMVRPVRAARGVLAHHDEITGLQRFAGITDPDEAHQAELEAYLDEFLPDSWRGWSFDAPTLPLSLDRLPVPGKVLSAAPNPKVLKARSLIKGITAKFYGYDLRDVPVSVWSRDGTPNPIIARSFAPWTNRFLGVLRTEVEKDAQKGTYELLPSRTQFGGVAIEPYPPRKEESEAAATPAT